MGLLYREQLGPLRGESLGEVLLPGLPVACDSLCEKPYRVVTEAFVDAVDHQHQVTFPLVLRPGECSEQVGLRD